jgi:hypothetical protein
MDNDISASQIGFWTAGAVTRRPRRSRDYSVMQQSPAQK